MLARPAVMTGLLGAAVGVPYAVHNAPSEWPDWNPAAPPPAAESAAPAPPAAQAAVVAVPQGVQFPNSTIYESPALLEGGGFISAEQVLRMDVSKDWVFQNWARKSTGLAEPNLFGVRVPVVTGTGMSDLAGSLSYYFNSAGRVDKLRFKGTTADTTRIVSIAQQHGLTWQQPRVPGEQLMQQRSGDQIVSQLRTYPEPVLWSTKPHGSFGVELELNRPDSGNFVTAPAAKLNLPPAPEVAGVSDEAPAAAAAAAAESTSVEAPKLQHAQRSDFRWPN